MHNPETPYIKETSVHITNMLIKQLRNHISGLRLVCNDFPRAKPYRDHREMGQRIDSNS